jgi:hypothetical protein
MLCTASWRIRSGLKPAKASGAPPRSEGPGFPRLRKPFTTAHRWATQMRAPPRGRKASWRSPRRAERMVRRRYVPRQDRVRSPPPRWRPKRVLRSPPWRARRTVIPRVRTALRQRGRSDAWSAWPVSGRWRGRPRGRLRGRRLAISASKTRPAGPWAAVRSTARGRPCRSTTPGRLRPAVPRSGGCGPVVAPPFGRGPRRCPRARGATRGCLLLLRGPPGPGAGASTPQPAATRAGGARRARHGHSPSRGAPSPTEGRSCARSCGPARPRGRARGAGPPSLWAAPAVGAAR